MSRKVPPLSIRITSYNVCYTKLLREKHKVFVGGYGGVILFRDSGQVLPAKYFHGSGGEAPVTRGAIQTNRQAVFLPDFQLVMNGHSHHHYIIPITRERVDSSYNFV